MLDGILWTDLNSSEQAALVFLRAGFALDACDPAAIKSLRRIGLVTENRLSRDAERMVIAIRPAVHERAA